MHRKRANSNHIVQLFDTHSHLYLPEFDSDRSDVTLRAREAGIVKIVLPAIDSTSHGKVVSVAQQAPDLFLPLMGLHPTSVKSNWENELEQVETYLKKHRFYGIGEVGIDLYWDKTFVEQQKLVFRRQVQLAKQLNLPVIIHTREAFPDVLQIIDLENDANLRGIFHSFSGTIDHYKHIASYGGFLVGIGGVVTYKNSGLAELVKAMDLEHIVLETDSPYLTPAPHRGKRNESSYLPHVVSKIAQIHGHTVRDIARITTQNAAQLFNVSI